MSRDRGLVAAGLIAGFMTVAAAFLLTGRGAADGSALSRSSRGWLAARRYLEERGCRAALLDHDLDVPPGPGVLVLAFPWQQLGFAELRGAIDRHLREGGDVLFAYSGRPFEASESTAAKALDLLWDERRERPPLNPIRWRQYAAEEWSLTPEPSLGGGTRPVRVSAPRLVPRAPQGATALLRDARGAPIAFRFTRGRGRVVALPADAFSNARLGQPGNADLLETLRQDLGEAWTFDEYHHGLRAPATAGEAGPQRVLVLYLLQIAFVYLLVVLAVVRRFGPAWSEPAVASGSAATFLVGLGALHRRLGHQREAARLLLARARELDGRLALPGEPEEDPGLFLPLARRVGEAQSRRSA